MNADPHDQADAPRPAPDSSAAYLAPYRDALERHGPTFEATLWRNEDFQRARFAVLCETIDLTGRIVLDAGCGRADFARYLLEHEVQYGRYIGVDAMPELMDAGKALGAPECEFHVRDFVADPDAFTPVARPPDVVVFSGSLNTLKLDDSMRVLDRAWDACTEALLFNFLSSRCPQAAHTAPDDPAQRYDPLGLLNWALARTPSVLFRQDYLQGHDATIAMWKPAPR
ncbi:MAG: methyltransferase domain-containing protein [Phycisphaerales bacterium]|nr:MAG: methyltransferase domain-containing protein [Phycisphaerales bacterium]